VLSAWAVWDQQLAVAWACKSSGSERLYAGILYRKYLYFGIYRGLLGAFKHLSCKSDILGQSLGVLIANQ
jgi:hypothetical protein